LKFKTLDKTQEISNCTTVRNCY